MTGDWLDGLTGLSGLLGLQDGVGGLPKGRNTIIAPKPRMEYDCAEELARRLLARLEVGDRPNVEVHVSDSSIWKTVEKRKGWRCQVNQISGFARIVSPDDVRMAKGSKTAMVEKLHRLTSKEFVRPGDILGVSRGGLYEHYAVYAGEGRVIHYCGEGREFGDFGGKVTVHEAPFSEFLKDADDYFVLWFDNGKPVRLHSATTFLFSSGWAASEEFYNHKRYSVYSAEETLRRARSRIGEEQYNLVTNNCEHFAMWCRTGKKESCQVNRFLQLQGRKEYRGRFSETGGIIKY